MRERREFSEGEWDSEFDGDGYLINGIIRVPMTYDEYPADAKLITAAPRPVSSLRGRTGETGLHSRRLGRRGRDSISRGSTSLGCRKGYLD